VTVDEFASTSICSVAPMNASIPLLPGQLVKDPVGAETSVASCEEDIGTGANVFLHADLASKRMDALYPAAFNGRNQGRVGIQGPVPAYFPAQAE
jgi:hypothetical protein